MWDFRSGRDIDRLCQCPVPEITVEVCGAGSLTVLLLTAIVIHVKANFMV